MTTMCLTFRPLTAGIRSRNWCRGSANRALYGGTRFATLRSTEHFAGACIEASVRGATRESQQPITHDFRALALPPAGGIVLRSR